MSAFSLDTHVVRHRRRTVRSTMIQVMVALVPGTVLYAYLLNPAVLANIAIACTTSLCTEAIILMLRKRDLMPALGDGSILLAAWLLALCVPPSLPASQLVIGVVIMVTLGKHLFGGLGHNPFNPAMVAYAVLIVSFPVTMTDWQIDDHHQSVNTPAWDAVTSATPLDRLRNIRLTVEIQQHDTDLSTNQLNTQASSDSRKQAGQLVTESVWAWLSVAWLAGGIYLLLIRVISWHIPVSVLGTLALLYAAVGVLSSSALLPAGPALLSGALIIGAFFIATDPVSAATSNLGKLIYGCGIGVLTFVIRENSVYPEGFAFAVLLMNICVPLIDHLITSSSTTPKLPVNKS